MRRQTPRFDFFAFQDIVTGTTGILIVITLLLSLSIGANRINRALDSRKAKAGEAEHILEANKASRILQTELQARQEALAELEAEQSQLAGYLQTEVDHLKYLLDQADPSTQYRRILPPRAKGLQHPTLAIAHADSLTIKNADGIVVLDLNLKRPLSQLQARMSDLVSSENGLLILVKPSAFAHYDKLSAFGLKNGKLQFPYCFDIIEEDWEVVL
ncbi:hypothetical protein [Coraliomargarita parva]|uniref:hypothetical protein n=1 Tax=Coraliomargarita parva TaxID=3014050 RepID=UPI0022B559A3|nr:hypothetical protein [Coraliomargarita parva]